jgi:hypothetical protein
MKRKELPSALTAEKKLRLNKKQLILAGINNYVRMASTCSMS